MSIINRRPRGHVNHGKKSTPGEHKKRFLATVNENGLDRLEIRRDN